MFGTVWNFTAFIKSFEAPQRSVKLKFKLIFSLRLGLGREGLILLVQFCQFLCKNIGAVVSS